jgi:hypothetical protein
MSGTATTTSASLPLVAMLGGNSTSNSKSMVGYVPAPRSRGTISLLLSCLTTAFLCTWTVLHLDVPRSDNRRTKRASFLMKAAWMATAAILPEVVVARAVAEYKDAREVQQELSSVDRGVWSLRQAFFLRMHGLVYKLDTPRFADPFIILDKDSIKDLLGLPLAWSGQRRSLLDTTGDASRQMTERLQFDDLPSDSVIQDKSKADALAKSLALLQSGWFLAQTITRAIQKLPVTTLELGISGLITSASVAYGFWWYKPQGVQLPIQIRTLNGVDKIYSVGNFGDWRTALWKPIPIAAFAIASLVVGGIHCAAWEFVFPTPTEQLLWRIASIFVTVVPVVEAAAIYHVNECSYSTGAAIMVFGGVIEFALPVSYALMRLFLIVEMFLSLRRVPSEVYQQISWVDFIPHL